MTEEVKAVHGEKMIELKVRFWTNDIAQDEDSVVPKNAWSAGVVRMKRNDTHGIDPQRPKTFNSLMELPGVIEDVLIEHGVKLRPSGKARRYFR
jgi:hypothetical protein